MLSVEFHCHTIFSKDSLTSPRNLVDTCRRKGIDRVVVTDHNTFAGALTAQKLDPELLIVGEEIMTTRGEILAAFVTEEIPPFLSPQETIRRLKEKGAFISVSHPFDRLRDGAWKEKDLLEIIPEVDAIEVFNSRCMNPRFNRDAQAFAEKQDVPGTVGSDAHAAFEVPGPAAAPPRFESSRLPVRTWTSAAGRQAPRGAPLPGRYAVSRPASRPKRWRSTRRAAPSTPARNRRTG